MSDTRHAVVLGPSLTLAGYRPSAQPFHHADFDTGNTARICGSLTNPDSGKARGVVFCDMINPPSCSRDLELKKPASGNENTEIPWVSSPHRWLYGLSALPTYAVRPCADRLAKRRCMPAIAWVLRYFLSYAHPQSGLPCVLTISLGEVSCQWISLLRILSPCYQAALPCSGITSAPAFNLSK